MKTSRPSLAATATVAGLALLGGAGCSLGQGTGEVYSESLYAPECWLNESYDLGPDFFAAVPYRNTLQIRVQRGNDLQEVSDGLAILSTTSKMRTTWTNLRRQPGRGLPPGARWQPVAGPG